MLEKLLEKLKYLSLQARQQYLEHKMQLLDIVAQESQKVSRGGKLAHMLSIQIENCSLFVKMSLIQVRERVDVFLFDILR